MLPEGFHWNPGSGLDGPALYCGDKLLATITPLPNGLFRLCLNPARLGLRYEFCESEWHAVIYAEAWAEKWEKRLRD